METQTNNISKASFLRWMKPILIALKELGGQGKPEDVRRIISRNEHLTEEQLSETRGKNKVNKFENEVAFARSYLVSSGYIDNGVYGIWKLTDQGWSVDMTDELTSNIFKQGVPKTIKSNELNYKWIKFYMEFADTLLQFKEKRIELIQKIKEVYEIAEFKLPKLEKNNEIEDIDPFTVFALFNKGITDKNRTKILSAISKIFNIKAEVPVTFDGIPVLNNLKSTFYYFRGERGVNDINNLWDLFYYAIQYSEKFSELDKAELQRCYDKVRKQKGVNWNITMGLYWIRPFIFINLDSINRSFITNVDNMPHYFITIFQDINKGLPDGARYLFMCEHARNALKSGEYKYHSFPELSYYAFISKNNEEILFDENSPDSGVKEISYWIFSPGNNASMWDEFYESGIMALGWDDVKDLREFTSKEEIKNYMKQIYDARYSYKNNALCLWQFAKEIKIGDIIFVKKGISKVIGKGIVTSDYIYDTSRKTYKHVRKVDWQYKGEWEHPDKAVVKTLTNITPYSDYVKKLLSLFEEVSEENQKEIEMVYPSYSKDDFLNEVFMNGVTYDTLVDLLETKYNVILQGPPGTGKTFAAKRIAYSIMGQKDISRVASVQFHQSYSYEDFIQGYRPSKEGFELVNGSFYKFCKEAEEDNERLYFFIIDEINRGNLSKIFGELMMLIEKDKRGQKLKLLYKDEWFTVPKNVRIIGMMNTADRSLAMMDYALRRRFAFFDFEPAFSSDGFRQYLENKNDEKLNRLISVVESLNNVIANDESLGEGFTIGHSYFCTDDEITDKWLNSVVEYELIPLLKEYWFDEPVKVRNWAANLRGSIR